jgi:hypothetical protein
MKAREHRRVAAAAVACVLVPLGVVSALAATLTQGSVSPTRLVRFDVARFVPAEKAIAPGGLLRWNGPNGQTLWLTGTGQALVGTSRASGGGLWTWKSKTGTVVARGTYRVTGLVGWHSAGGTLEANVTDTIANPADGRNGDLRLDASFTGTRSIKGIVKLASDAALPLSGKVTPGVITLATPSGSIHFSETTRPAGQLIFHAIPLG